uniref:Nitroreductase domain-containing protein n=2 Tax=Thermofilum pendens TaxID=2269 RepID=A0A7J3X6E4_THEPE
MIRLPNFTPRERPWLREALWCLANGAVLQADPCGVDCLARIAFSTQGLLADGRRTAPSAGGTYPLHLYILSSGGLPVGEGAWRYNPLEHCLEDVEGISGYFDGFLISVEARRTYALYGERGYRYVRLEVGHALQNLLLSLTSHGLPASVDVVTLELSSAGETPCVKVALRKETGALCRGFQLEPSIPLDRAFLERRSVREYSRKSLDLEAVVRVLKWSLGELTPGGRPYPRLQGGYRVEAVVVAGRVRGLEEGVYAFDPASMELELLRLGDYMGELCSLSLRQYCVCKAPAVIVLGGEGLVSEVEAGLIAQNIYLNVVQESLGTVAVGAFEDEGLSALTGLERPIYLLPIGYPVR